MSTAAAFKYYNRFPFCAAATDYSWGDLGSMIFIIKDLTLADAMKLYWNLETVDIGFNLSAVFDGSVTHSTNFSVTLPAVGKLGSERKPRDRVCYVADKQSGIYGTAAVSSAVSYSSGGGDDWRHGWAFSRDSSSAGVVPQTDGKYQYIFGYDDGISAALAGGGGLHIASKSVTGGGGAYVDTTLTQTVSVLSGSVRFNFIASGAAFTYTGTPSFSSATLSPAYYTY